MQVFARKLTKVFGTTTLSDIQNELRAVDKLCRNLHEHVVIVYRRGKLVDSPYRFIDMEFCEMNLEQYIYTTPETDYLSLQQPLNSHFIWSILKDVSNGLAFIQGQSEVHRDMKPPNGTSPPSSSNKKSCIPLYKIPGRLQILVYLLTIRPPEQVSQQNCPEGHQVIGPLSS